jgi:hypothetical protein
MFGCLATIGAQTKNFKICQAETSVVGLRFPSGEWIGAGELSLGWDQGPKVIPLLELALCREDQQLGECGGKCNNKFVGIAFLLFRF